MAKLIAYGSDRAEAIARMRRALDMFVVEGIYTSIPLHRKILDASRFRRGPTGYGLPRADGFGGWGEEVGAAAHLEVGYSLRELWKEAPYVEPPQKKKNLYPDLWPVRPPHRNLPRREFPCLRFPDAAAIAL